MYAFGQQLMLDAHFQEHMSHKIPVQVYRGGEHIDIGFIQGYTKSFAKINNLYFHRGQFNFVSRPGY